jgi:DNA-binding NtrC family response regulator
VNDSALFSKRPHIVVVEDDESISELLSEALSDEGYRVTSFATAEPATFAAIQQCRPDLVISDLRVPGAVGGLTLLELIVGDTVTQRIPLIVCSAANDLEAVASQLGPGRVVPLAKPFEIDALLSTVAAALAEAGGLLR